MGNRALLRRRGITKVRNYNLPFQKGYYITIMTSQSLVQYFKANPVFTTNIGDFEFVKNIGQGGNGTVLKFRKGNSFFAIKFLAHIDQRKLNRFKDEFFCAAQIPSHRNIVETYHFESKEMNEANYSFIVMKFYATTLHELGSESKSTKDIQTEKVKKLFSDLMNGLNHLHINGIIHRDIKPQNILFDEISGNYIIADLGIAHFNDEEFAKEALTKAGERLANYLFSAPEQADSRNPPIPANDIYALGQILQWYLCGKSLGGLGRVRFADDPSQKALHLLDQVVSKCLLDNPSQRFQSIEEIKNFIDEQKKPKERDPWIKLHDFDDVIKRSFPSINKVIETKNPDQISAFFNNFQTSCMREEFWFVNADGGDNTFVGLTDLSNGMWLLNNEDEIKISKLIVYNDPNYEYKNFFIILTAANKPFSFSTPQGQTRRRKKETLPSKQDYAIFYNGNYISPDETTNGYYAAENATIPVTRKDFQDRYRHVVPYAFLIVPTQTASACMLDRTPTEDLLQSVIKSSTLDPDALKTYLQKTRSYHSTEITKWN